MHTRYDANTVAPRGHGKQEKGKEEKGKNGKKQ
jgi:hypothetical protein